MKIVGATDLAGLWALEWACCRRRSFGRLVGVRVGVTNLRCVRNSGICTPNLYSLALIISEISALIRTDGRTDMARSTRLVIRNIYTFLLYGGILFCDKKAVS